MRRQASASDDAGAKGDSVDDKYTKKEEGSGLAGDWCVPPYPRHDAQSPRAHLRMLRGLRLFIRQLRVQGRDRAADAAVHAARRADGAWR